MKILSDDERTELALERLSAAKRLVESFQLGTAIRGSIRVGQFTIKVTGCCAEHHSVIITLNQEVFEIHIGTAEAKEVLKDLETASTIANAINKQLQRPV